MGRREQIGRKGRTEQEPETRHLEIEWGVLGFNVYLCNTLMRRTSMQQQHNEGQQ